MTLETLVNATPAITRVLNIELPMKTHSALGFKLSNLTKAVQPILAAYNDTRNRLITELGEQNDKGIMEVRPLYINTFHEQMKLILKEEIEMPVVQTFTIAELPEGANLKSAEIAALSPWLITE